MLLSATEYLGSASLLAPGAGLTPVMGRMLVVLGGCGGISMVTGLATLVTSGGSRWHGHPAGTHGLPTPHVHVGGVHGGCGVVQVVWVLLLRWRLLRAGNAVADWSGGEVVPTLGGDCARVRGVDGVLWVDRGAHWLLCAVHGGHGRHTPPPRNVVWGPGSHGRPPSGDGLVRGGSSGGRGRQVALLRGQGLLWIGGAEGQGAGVRRLGSGGGGRSVAGHVPGNECHSVHGVQLVGVTPVVQLGVRGASYGRFSRNCRLRREKEREREYKRGHERVRSS